MQPVHFSPSRSTREDGSDRSTTTIAVRVSKRERDYIEGIARRHWVSMSEVIRQHIAAGMEAERVGRKRSQANGRRATVRRP